ncbi:hypothetical protein K505DRAFT_46999 [Melanomma pulvis-pyrius CBS 109.77]|uniref:Uncharacterized protein n=1 Tax=Melanomma pulvis-pyrius CBS 109.77 TaxID=1314802 RepID=A0A6A6X9E0_9PLEO|nr:hypothetical protein K505DRAFT_46999 [Melanomma pulvis-pyrius CBS 109.77]
MTYSRRSAWNSSTESASIPQMSASTRPASPTNMSPVQHRVRTRIHAACQRPNPNSANPTFPPPDSGHCQSSKCQVPRWCEHVHFPSKHNRTLPLYTTGSPHFNPPTSGAHGRATSLCISLPGLQ